MKREEKEEFNRIRRVEMKYYCWSFQKKSADKVYPVLR